MYQVCYFGNAPIFGGLYMAGYWIYVGIYDHILKYKMFQRLPWPPCVRIHHDARSGIDMKKNLLFI